MKKSSLQERRQRAVGLGICLGICIGVAVDQLALGLALGAAWGYFFPDAFDRFREDQEEKEQ